MHESVVAPETAALVNEIVLLVSEQDTPICGVLFIERLTVPVNPLTCPTVIVVLTVNPAWAVNPV